MISVRVRRTVGKVEQVTVSGHAGHAPKGEDLICAAVSALVQTFLFSLQRLLHINVVADVSEGFLSLTLPLDLDEWVSRDVTLLADSMLVGLDEIDNSYPGFLEVIQV
jgi:hypothetical protein